MPRSVHEILRMRKEAKQLSEQANAILQTATGRPLTAEEDQQFEAAASAAESLLEQVTAAEAEHDTDLARSEREARASTIASEVSRGLRGATREQHRLLAAGEFVAQGGEASTAEEERLRKAGLSTFSEAYRRTLGVYLRQGYGQLTLEERATLRPPRAFLEELQASDPKAFAAVSSFSDTSLGYLVSPEALQPMTTATKYFGGMAEVADVIETDTGREIPYPVTDDTATQGRYIGENKAVAEVSAGTVGVVPIKAHTCTSDVVLVPQEFLQDVGIDFEAWLFARFGERIGRRRNLAMTTGDGAFGPLGILASTGGAALGHTTATGQTTQVKFNDLTDLEHSVDISYRADARYMGHDTTIANLKKLLDSTGRPIWQVRVDLRQPSTINEYGYVVNNDMPTIAASAKVVLFGAFKNYKLRVVRNRWVRRLEERYAENGQVGFIMYERHDARLIDAGQNPVKYLKMAAA